MKITGRFYERQEMGHNIINLEGEIFIQKYENIHCTVDPCRNGTRNIKIKAGIQYLRYIKIIFKSAFFKEYF